MRGVAVGAALAILAYGLAAMLSSLHHVTAPAARPSLCPPGQYAYLTGIGKDANGNGYLATIMCLRDK